MAFIARHGSCLQYVTATQKRQGIILVMGIMIFATGTMFLCNIAALAMTSWSVIGLMLCVTGAVQFFAALQMRERMQFAAWLPVVACYVLFGALALYDPPHRFAFVNHIFFVGLVMTGLLRSYGGYIMRPANGAGWLVAAGVVTLAIGTYLISQWPSNSLSVAGILLAVDLMAYGVGFIGFSMNLNKPRIVDRVG